MAKVGRPSGLNEKIKETILRLIKEGKTEEQIADVLGICRKTLSNWKGAHPELLHAVRESRQAADELVEASLYRRALGYSHPEQKVFCEKGAIFTHDMERHYPPDTQAAMFWLRNRQPERWKEKTEGDVTVNTNVNTLTDEQLDAKIAAIQAKSKVKNAGSK